MIILRPYQEQAKQAVYRYLRTREDNPAVVIPTAGGKTPIIASICKDAVGLWQGRVLILAHVKELLEQTADKLRQVCSEVRFGVYSAGLKRRDTTHDVIVAGIQSVFRRACELDAFDLIIIDEAHMVPAEGEGMYRTFLAEAKQVNPHLRVIGLTATPFRLKTGPICTSENILNSICFEVGVRELIRDGYLCPLISKNADRGTDFDRLHVRGGEFQADELEALMDDDKLVSSACRELATHSQHRRGVLIFASGVRHGQHLVRTLQEQHGLECGFVSGETPLKERDAVLDRFRQGKLRLLCNVNVLTTGFDAPHIDCVALVRPTMSPGLYYQMVGRGFRLHPDKQNCLVLDFGGNVLRHGPVDQIEVVTHSRGEGKKAPAKECPDCHTLVATGYARCPECGHTFPPPQRGRHEAKAGSADILSTKITTTSYDVSDVIYSVHRARHSKESDPRTLRVDYQVGWQAFKSEWVCLEHTGYARQKAIVWWKRRSPDPVPQTAEQAVDIAEGGGLATTKRIIVVKVAGDPFERISSYELGPVPEPLESTPASSTSEEAPF